MKPEEYQKIAAIVLLIALACQSHTAEWEPENPPATWGKPIGAPALSEDQMNTGHIVSWDNPRVYGR